MKRELIVSRCCQYVKEDIVRDSSEIIIPPRGRLMPYSSKMGIVVLNNLGLNPCLPSRLMGKHAVDQPASECRYKEDKTDGIGEKSRRHQENAGNYQHQAMQTGFSWHMAGSHLFAGGKQHLNALQSDQKSAEGGSCQTQQYCGQATDLASYLNQKIELQQRGQNEQKK